MTTAAAAPDGVNDPQTERILEALLFASREPLSETVLASHLPEYTDIHAALAALAERYADSGVNLVEIGGAWAMRTAADLAYVLRREAEVQRRMSRAALETLAIVAYHQPVTSQIRAEQGDARYSLRTRLDSAARATQYARSSGDLGLDPGFPRPFRPSRARRSSRHR